MHTLQDIQRGSMAVGHEEDNILNYCNTHNKIHCLQNSSSVTSSGLSTDESHQCNVVLVPSQMKLGLESLKPCITDVSFRNRQRHLMTSRYITHLCPRKKTDTSRQEWALAVGRSFAIACALALRTIGARCLIQVSQDECCTYQQLSSPSQAPSR